MNKILVVWFANNIKDPATWAGTGLIAVFLHMLLPKDGALVNQILIAGAGIGGLLAYLLPNSTTKKAVAAEKAAPVVMGGAGRKD